MLLYSVIVLHSMVIMYCKHNDIGLLFCRGTVIGIDLGTSNSCVAFLEERRTPKIIEASRATPSIVALDGDNKLLVGLPAKQQVHHNHIINHAINVL